MVTGFDMLDERARKQRAFAAAARRFPSFELSIKRLIEADDTFFEICDELAEAGLALAAVEQVPVPLQRARRAEWQDLVDRLVAEVATALSSDTSARL
jgi:hypothetical protein